MNRTDPRIRPPRGAPEAGWRQSLSAGVPGIALLHIAYAHTGAGEWDTVHRWATAMTAEPVTAHPDACGLYHGAPALAFTFHAAAQPTYAAVSTILDGHVATVTRQRLARAHERIDSGRLPSLREFDLISGLTGLGVCLLRHSDDPGVLHDVLSYLVRLTQPVTVDGETLPGWWSPNGPDDRPSARWPGGHGNLGVAHGIAGPLALLSATMRRGITVPGHAEAIARICDWLDRWRRGTPPDIWWPGTIPRAELHHGSVRQVGPPRPSWCYGTPGLARAQQLGALALRDPQRQRHAEDALARCITAEAQLAQIGDASLCHGWAGILQSTWRAAIDAGTDSHLAVLVHQLRTRLHQHLDRHGPPAADGLLLGRAGIHLALHTTANDRPPAVPWDACLLLDG